MNNKEVINHLVSSKKETLHSLLVSNAKTLISHAKRLEFYLEHPEEFLVPEKVDDYMYFEIHDIAQTSMAYKQRLDELKAQIESYLDVCGLVGDDTED